MVDEADVTHWLHALQAGDLAAAQPLWEQYYDRLVRLAKGRLPRRAMSSESEAASSALNSFFRSAADGRFPKLADRNDLWRLLVYIVGKKIADQIEREAAKKRGGQFGRAGEDALLDVVGREPSPEFAVAFADELDVFLIRLGDDRLRQIAIWKMEGYTNEEISSLINCSLRTVANKLMLIRRVMSQT
jgi:DNA-directed RNA polymerase specialized sigma24 family protein